MKLPWYLKETKVNYSKSEFGNLTLKINPWYVLFKKIQILLKKIYVKFQKGIRKIIEFPGD